jgi:hypothetical protein
MDQTSPTSTDQSHGISEEWPVGSFLAEIVMPLSVRAYSAQCLS